MSAELEPRDGSLDDAPHELRALYERLQPPPLADGLDEVEPETARVVAWMQGAWSTLAVPPLRLPRRAPRPLRRLARRALLVAAALLLLVGGRYLLPALVRDHSPPAAPLAHGPAAVDSVEILAVRPDLLELRSGPVRLVLLEPPALLPPDPSGS